MNWEKMLAQPAALAAGGVVVAAFFAFLGSVITTVLARRKHHVDRLREALTTDVVLLEKVPKGSDAYKVLRETIDHAARELAIRQRQRTDQYYTMVIIIVPILVFSTVVFGVGSIGSLIAAGGAWRIPIALMIAALIGYGYGRLQAWIVGFANGERIACGFTPLLGTPIRQWLVRVGHRLQVHRGHPTDPPDQG